MSEIPPRLRWACRRGMLELDILLGNFLEQVYITLTPEEQVWFVQLLERNDQELFEWLTKDKIPPTHELTYMIDKVKQNARRLP